MVKSDIFGLSNKYTKKIPDIGYDTRQPGLDDYQLSLL
jgi:hypothetical protein